MLDARWQRRFGCLAAVSALDARGWRRVWSLGVRSALDASGRMRLGKYVEEGGGLGARSGGALG